MRGEKLKGANYPASDGDAQGKLTGHGAPHTAQQGEQEEGKEEGNGNKAFEAPDDADNTPAKPQGNGNEAFGAAGGTKSQDNKQGNGNEAFKTAR